MQQPFFQEHTLSALHVNRYGRLKLSALLYLAQSAADGHCRELSLDWDTLHKKGLFWAVVRHRVQITRLPIMGETVRVETWPMPTTRSAFPRATVGYDAQGKELFRCISLWVLMDCNSRAMVLPGKSGIDLDGLLQGNELAPPGSIAPFPSGNTSLRRVNYTELDRNGHLNNTRYLEWVDDLLPSQFHGRHIPREFIICYLSEAKEGEEIHINWQLGDGPLLRVDATRIRDDDPQKTDRVFAAQVQF